MLLLYLNEGFFKNKFSIKKLWQKYSTSMWKRITNIVRSGQTKLHFMYHFCFSFFTMENYHLYPIIVILSIISIICPPDSFSLKLRHASLILKFLLTDFYCGWYDGYLQTNGGPVWYSNIFTGKNQSMKTLT